jgi:hypothetical protein
VPAVVDTVGAGDGFAVGLISALLEGLPADQAAGRGNQIAALVIQQIGDSEGLPTRERFSTNNVMRKRIVVYKKLPESELAKLQRFFEITQFGFIDNENRNSFLEAIKAAHGLLGASVKFTEEMLSGADHLEAISTISVGYATLIFHGSRSVESF